MAFDASQIIKALDKAKAARAVFNSYWQDVADLVLPTRDFVRKTVPGDYRRIQIFNGTAPNACMSLASALHGLLMNPSIRWFALESEDFGDRGDDESEEWLFDANLDIVIPSLRRAARASFKVSWNTVADSCAQAFSRLYDLVEEPEAVVRDADAFFGDPSSPMYRQLTMEVFGHRGKLGLFSRRGGCCLYWRTKKSDDFCSNCILLTREQQDTRFRQTLEGRR